MKELTLITQKDKPTHKTHNMGSGGHTQHGERQHGRDNMERTWTWGERGKDTHTTFESRDIRAGTFSKMTHIIYSQL